MDEFMMRFILVCFQLLLFCMLSIATYVLVIEAFKGDPLPYFLAGFFIIAGLITFIWQRLSP